MYYSLAKLAVITVKYYGASNMDKNKLKEKDDEEQRTSEDDLEKSEKPLLFSKEDREKLNEDDKYERHTLV